MAAEIKPVHRKSWRSAGVRSGRTIPARFEQHTIQALDGWAMRNGLSRSEAISRLVAMGLGLLTETQVPQRVHSIPLAELNASNDY